MGAAFSALGINAGNLFVSTICLIIAWLIIARFIVGPVQKVASERQAVIDSGMENARKSKQMIADAEQRAAEIVSSAEAKATEIIKTATDQTIKLREDYQAQLDAENVKQLRSTKAYLDQERDLMLTHLRDQIIDLSIVGAKKLIQENLKIDPDKQRQMLIELFTGIRDRKFLSVPEELQSNLPRIEVTTAIALTDEERELVTEELKPRLSDDGEVVFQIDPKILGGVVVHSGNILIDHSISGRARELRDALHQ